MSSNRTSKLQRMMTLPINQIFKHLQQKDRVSIWLFDQTDIRIEGVIIGFDEYMNIVLDKADEVCVSKTKKAGNSPGARKPIGRVLLKGDNVCLIQSAPKQ